MLSITSQCFASSEEDILNCAKILNRLNNDKRCDVPTYEETDTLNNCFHDLVPGGEPKSELVPDLEIAGTTVLYQWASFKKYMFVPKHRGAIRSATHNAFVGKVIQYQKRRYGHSICEAERYEGNNFASSSNKVEVGSMNEPHTKHVKEPNFDYNSKSSSPVVVDFQSLGGSKDDPSVGQSHDDAPKFEIDRGENGDREAKNYSGKVTYWSNIAPKRVTMKIYH